MFTPEPNAASKYPPLEGQSCLGMPLFGFKEKDILSKRQIDLNYLLEGYFFLEEDLFLESGYFEKLVGNGALRQQLIEGKSVDEIKASWKEDLDTFKQIRKKYLLYEDFE